MGERSVRYPPPPPTTFTLDQSGPRPSKTRGNFRVLGQNFLTQNSLGGTQPKKRARRNSNFSNRFVVRNNAKFWVEKCNFFIFPINCPQKPQKFSAPTAQYPLKGGGGGGEPRVSQSGGGGGEGGGVRKTTLQSVRWGEGWSRKKTSRYVCNCWVGQVSTARKSGVPERRGRETDKMWHAPTTSRSSVC